MLGLGLPHTAYRRRNHVSGAITLDFVTGQGSEAFSFSRSSSATYTASSGLVAQVPSDTARIEHGPRMERRVAC